MIVLVLVIKIGSYSVATRLGLDRGTLGGGDCHYVNQTSRAGPHQAFSKSELQIIATSEPQVEVAFLF